MIRSTILLCLSLLLVATACAQEEGITIPTTPPTGRLPLEQRIPISKTHTANVVLYENNAVCFIKIGGLQDINLELPAPCDITTKGSGFSFDPVVDYNSKDDKPGHDVGFEIVGALKYYPAGRVECGKTWRNVIIKWKNEVVKGKSKFTPYIELSKIGTPNSGKPIVCPRKYDDIK